VTLYRIEADLAVALDVEAAFVWYEAEQPNLGFDFLEQLGAAYNRILNNPLAYQEIRSGIRRAFASVSVRYLLCARR
jgi:hypothetical protein